eukprot:gene11957-8231_t
MQKNRVASLFGVKYPIVQGGMVWCSGWRLASAVSNAGGLGLIGAGSMNLGVFQENLAKCKAATQKPFGVNLPLNGDHEPYMQLIMKEKVPIVFTSAGSPKLYTKTLKQLGIKVVHVVPSTKLAVKCCEAGVDAIVAEGFEAGGHNGLEELTTMTLIPSVRRHLDPKIPLIAAGGIADGGSTLAAFALGAEGVQIGTRFAVTKESSASDKFKQVCVEAKEGCTYLSLKQMMPTRLYLNEYGKAMVKMANSGATKEELKKFRGRGKTRQGIFDGDVVNGEIEIGQIVHNCDDIPTAGEVVQRIVTEFNEKAAQLGSFKL